VLDPNCRPAKTSRCSKDETEFTIKNMRAVKYILHKVEYHEL